MDLTEIDLGKEYLKYCELKDSIGSNNFLDLSNMAWLFPVFLLPLGIYIKEHTEIKVRLPQNTDVANYFDLILKGEINSIKKTYIPIVEIEPNRSFIEGKLEELISNQNLRKKKPYCFQLLYRKANR